MTLVAQQQASDLIIDSDTTTSTTGYFQLSWQGGQHYVVQQAETENFSHVKTIYQGEDTATSMTGLPDNSYYYRVGTKPASDAAMTWSKPIRVVVAHHSLSRALLFFAMGASVFIAVLVAIYLGNKKYNGMT